jgi:hypothetical protein
MADQCRKPARRTMSTLPPGRNGRTIRLLCQGRGSLADCRHDSVSPWPSSSFLRTVFEHARSARALHHRGRQAGHLGDSGFPSTDRICRPSRCARHAWQFHHELSKSSRRMRWCRSNISIGPMRLLRSPDPSTEKMNSWFRGNPPFEKAKSATSQSKSTTSSRCPTRPIRSTGPNSSAIARKRNGNAAIPRNCDCRNDGTAGRSVIRLNPIGLYVRDFDWTAQL